MISVCITVKNRSREIADGRPLHLFPNCVESIRRAAADVAMEVELVIADWNSTDWPLREWLPEKAGDRPWRIVDLDGAATFSRGEGLNIAARAAGGDVLFFTDADSLVNGAVLSRGLRAVEQGQAYFPVFYYFDDPGHHTGRWWRQGYGQAMLARSLFEQSGGWPEYRRYGREDVHFFERIGAIAEVIREDVPGFCHQWHPQDILWKDRYGNRRPDEIAEIKQTRIAAHELANIVPAGETLILVDEARFGIDEIEGRKVLPFLEQNGAYAGAPADDDTAIREFVRLHTQGANFAAFAWMAFWWLDYYAKFREFLDSRYRRIRQDEQLIVFDLRART